MKGLQEILTGQGLSVAAKAMIEKVIPKLQMVPSDSHGLRHAISASPVKFQAQLRIFSPPVDEGGC